MAVLMESGTIPVHQIRNSSMSLRWKLVLSIGLPVIIVYGVLIWVQFDTLRDTAMANARQRAQLVSESWASHFNGQLHGIAQAVDAMAAVVGQQSVRNEDSLYNFNEQLIDQNELIAGSSIAFEPGAWEQETDRYAPYSWMTDGSTNRRDLALDYDYLERDWYRVGVDGEAGWTEPYDGPVFGSLLVTYSSPVIQNGVIIGVIAADIALLPLQQRLKDEAPEGLSTILASASGRLIAHPNPALILSDSLQSEADRTLTPELHAWVTDIQDQQAGFQALTSYPDDRAHWLLYEPVQEANWSMGTAIAEDDILAPVHQQLVLNLIFMGIGLCALLAVIAAAGFKIAKPVRQLANAVKQLGEGDLDVQVAPPPGQDEIVALARGFNDMTGRLKHNLEVLAEETEARERVEGEIRVARKIQEMLLPESFPALPSRDDVEVWAINEPARVVAGDFFDVIDHGEKITIVLGDVSGKGAGAAIFMAMARTIIRMYDAEQTSLPELVRELNGQLYPDSHGAMFVTMIILRYDTRTGELELVNGGHPPPIRFSNDSIEEVGDSTGPLVGAIDEAEWSTLSTSLHPGDRLILFTDGVTEAMDADGKQLGTQGLLQLLNQSPLAKADPSDLCRGLVEAIQQREPGEAGDDITVLVLARPKI